MLKLPPFLARYRSHRVIVVGAALLLGLVALGSTVLATGGFSGSRQPTQTPNPSPAGAPTATPTPTRTPTPPPTEPTLIDGVRVYPEQLTELEARLPLAVIVDNLATAARPQVNLDKADLVFEAVAEGGITRFLAIYWRSDPGVIESVRSARVYYLDWAAELDAIFVHWGFASSDGPADAPSALSRLGLRHFDGFFYGRPMFERDLKRAGPHDGIANSGALWEQAARNGWGGPPAIDPWAFKEDDPARAGAAEAVAADTIDLGFGGPFFSEYAVRWTYDAGPNSYLRSMGGVPHLDGASGERIRAKNVAVMVTDVWSAGDGTAHLLYRTTGEGWAVVFRDGVAVEGRWQKPSPTERTRFYDAAGNEIAFNRGQTWIEVLSAGDPLSY